MRFGAAFAALVAGASAFSVTIDKGLIGQIAHNWGSTLEDFMRKSDEMDRETIKIATPYLEEMDRQLQSLANISQAANERLARMAWETSQEGMKKMMADLQCSPPDTYEVKYERCDMKDCCRNG